MSRPFVSLHGHAACCSCFQLASVHWMHGNSWSQDASRSAADDGELWSPARIELEYGSSMFLIHHVYASQIIQSISTQGILDANCYWGPWFLDGWWLNRLVTAWIRIAGPGCPFGDEKPVWQRSATISSEEALNQFILFFVVHIVLWGPAGLFAPLSVSRFYGYGSINSSLACFMTICLVRKMASFARVHRKQDAHLVSCQQPLLSSSLSLLLDKASLPNNLHCQKDSLEFKIHAFLVRALTEFASHDNPAKFSLGPQKMSLLPYPLES